MLLSIRNYGVEYSLLISGTYIYIKQENLNKTHTHTHTHFNINFVHIKNLKKIKQFRVYKLKDNV